MGSKMFLSLGEQIFQTLKDRIVENHYMPGTMLQIDKLAEELGVSSTPIRETLFKLDAIGLVRMIRNKGAVVSEISEHMAKDVWQFRIILETFCALETATSADMETLKTLRDKILYLMDSPSDLALYQETDRQLHSMLYDRSSNLLVRDALANLLDHSKRIRYFAESSPLGADVVNQVCREHLDIIDAMIKRDSEAVKSTLEHHLLNGEKRALKALAASRPPSADSDAK